MHPLCLRLRLLLTLLLLLHHGKLGRSVLLVELLQDVGPSIYEALALEGFMYLGRDGFYAAVLRNQHVYIALVKLNLLVFDLRLYCLRDSWLHLRLLAHLLLNVLLLLLLLLLSLLLSLLLLLLLDLKSLLPIYLLDLPKHGRLSMRVICWIHVDHALAVHSHLTLYGILHLAALQLLQLRVVLHGLKLGILLRSQRLGSQTPLLHQRLLLLHQSLLLR